MEPLIQEYVDRVNAGVKDVLRVADLEDEVPSFGYGSMPEFSARLSFKNVHPVPVFRPCEYATKKYRDKGCAVFKILQQLEVMSKYPMKAICWRVEPEIDEAIDYDTYIKHFRGYMRFAWGV